MSSVVISGDTSGAITVSAPAVAGTNTLTLQAATATSSVNTLGTALAYNWNGLTTNTFLDFTGLPSWIKRLTVMFNGVSLSSTANILIQIGPSGGVETSGYSGVVFGNAVQGAWGGTGCLITRTGQATSTYSGIVTIANITGSTWVCSATMGDSVNAYAGFSAGAKAITGTLSILRITSTSTDTFDAGTVNIMYEG